MPLPPAADRPVLAPVAKALLGALRRRIRRYIWLEGCAAAVAWLGAAFWLTLAADWFFEPPPAARAVMLAAVAAVLAAVVVRLIGRRILVRISDTNAAMLLERRFPHLNDSLLTAVALGDHATAVGTDRLAAAGTAARIAPGADVPSAAKRPDADSLLLAGHGDATVAIDPNREMLAQTCRQAEERIAEVDLSRVFNRRPLYLHGGAAALLSISVALFAILCFTEFGIWARRTLAMSQVPWPRNTRLEVIGFENGGRKVARGADFEVVVRAHAKIQHMPEAAEIRYRTEGGGRGRATMDRRGAARGPKDCYQEYVYTFRGILADIDFDVFGGDDCKRGYCIEAVDSPTVSQMTVECQLPDYIGRRQPPLPVTGVMQIPMGSRVKVVAGQANKEIVAVQVSTAVGDRATTAEPLDSRDLAADRRGFSYKLGPLAADTTVLFTLTDSDGIESRDPVRLALVALPDQPPQVAVRLDGIGTAITPAARVAVSGQISDDYGIGRVWFERAIDQQPPRSHVIAEFRPPRAVCNLADAGLDLRELGLKPGQRLSVSVKAADLCNLGHGPNVASTEAWLLDVVTPDQLRAMLAARELILRQRFEQMIQEMSDTRDLLARMQFGREGAGVRGQGAGAGENPKSETRNPKPEIPKSRSVAEPGDEEPVDSAERRRELRFLRVQGALTNCHKGAPEVLGAAESFDDIYKQFVNNRIDTPELKNRLKANIAEPLHRIAESMFADLGRRIEELQAALDDFDRAPRLRDAAQQQTEAILLAMQKVRDQMMEMEDFNEAVELLRNIVDMQKQLREETKKRHDEKIRDLLEK